MHPHPRRDQAERRQLAYDAHQRADVAIVEADAAVARVTWVRQRGREQLNELRRDLRSAGTDAQRRTLSHCRRAFEVELFVESQRAIGAARGHVVHER